MYNTDPNTMKLSKDFLQKETTSSLLNKLNWIEKQLNYHKTLKKNFEELNR